MLYKEINTMPTLIQTNNESKWDMIVPLLLSPSFQQTVNKVLHELDVISLFLIDWDFSSFHH